MNENTIFNAAVKLPPQQRSDFLAAACHGNSQMRDEVEALICEHDGVGSFMQSPPAGACATLDLTTTEQPGTLIGRYKLLEQIGEGGMGVVFVAEQTEPVRRRVALKIIKPGMDTKQVIARFEAERQALAMMDHPNIAKILDAGTTGIPEVGGQKSEVGQEKHFLTSDLRPLTSASPRPYFVMELVRGLPITDYCDKAKLSPRQRLELFIDVCHAVQHAHQKGIIHRDLKPSNVMVTMQDGRAVVKVIDFGVAKAMCGTLARSASEGHTVYTAFNQLIGTPLYMSPEQAELTSHDVDTRSDVYSLGVLLYELLTGQTPFDKETLNKAGFDEMRRMIREDEPPRPSQRVSTLNARASSTISQQRSLDERHLTRVLRGELDWIVMRSLEKDRSRRYESASDLAADIRRYLAGEVVLALPPSFLYRSSKFVRRHRVLLTASAFVGLSLLLGTVASTWQAYRAWHAESIASSNSQFARQAVDDMYSQFAQQWIASEGNLSPVQREFLEKALNIYEEFSRNPSAEPAHQYEALRALYRLAAIQWKLGRRDQSESNFRRVVREAATKAATHPNVPAFRVLLVQARCDLAIVIKPLGRVAESNAEMSAALAELNQLQDVVLPETRLRRELAHGASNLTQALGKAADYKSDAERVSRYSVGLWRNLVAEEPDSWPNKVGLAIAYEHQGVQQMWWGGRNKEARESFVEAKQGLISLLKERPRDPVCRRTLAGVHWSLGVICGWEKDWPQAIEHDQAAIAIHESLITDFPEDASLLKHLSSLLANHAKSLSQLDKQAHAAAIHCALQRSVELLTDLSTRFPENHDYQTAWAEKVADHLYLLLERSEHHDARQMADAASERIAGIALTDETSRLANAVAKATAAIADVYLELGHWTSACKSLQSLTPTRIPSDRFGHADSESLYWNHTFVASRWQFLLSAIGNDPSLLPSDRESIRQRGRVLMKSFDQRAADVLRDWQLQVATLDSFQNELARYVFSALEARCAAAEQAITAEKADTEMVAFSRREFTQRFTRQHELRMARALIDVALEHQTGKPPLHCIVGYLTAGPPELRDNELALSHSRHIVKLYPGDKLAKQNLGWALYRAGQWEACLEALEGDLTSFNAAIGAMALKHLTRDKEAHALLADDYRRSIAGYLKRSAERREKKMQSYPTTEMVRCLDHEATVLVGVPPP